MDDLASIIQERIFQAKCVLQYKLTYSEMIYQEELDGIMMHYSVRS
jgi:hypothetical protein